MMIFIGLLFILAGQVIWMVDPAATAYVIIETVCGLMCLALATVQKIPKQ